MPTQPIQTTTNNPTIIVKNAIRGSADGLVGFHGEQPIPQPKTSAVQTLTPSAPTSGGYGFATSAEFTAFQAQLIAINTAISNLGMGAIPSPQLHSLWDSTAPHAMALSADGILYISEATQITQIDTKTGVKSVVPDVVVDNPQGLCVDSQGTLYYSNESPTHPTFYKRTSDGTVSDVLALNTTFYLYDVEGMAIGPDDCVYLTHPDRHLIVKYDPIGNVVTNIAGNGNQGHTDGGPGIASFNFPHSIAVAPNGDIYVGDGSFNIRKITRSGTPDNYIYTTTTLAGTPLAGGNRDGAGNTTTFGNLYGIALDAQGFVYVVSINSIRKIAPDGTTTTVAGQTSAGLVDGPLGLSKLSSPYGILSDQTGNIYIADTSNNKIRLLR